MGKEIDIGVIRLCDEGDFEAVCSVINDSAGAYRGAIPQDRFKEPYMPLDELMHEVESGVVFYGCEEGGELLGVMGIQDKGDVVLIRHAYVRTEDRNRGIGGKLIGLLYRLTSKPVLMGTWAAAAWAVRFYERHGFRLVTYEEKERLLRKYWSVPERQVETSVVLADRRWFGADLERKGL